MRESEALLKGRRQSESNLERETVGTLAVPDPSADESTRKTVNYTWAG